MKILKVLNFKKYILAALIATTSILSLGSNTLNVSAAKSSKVTTLSYQKTEPYYFGEDVSKYKDYTDLDIPPAVKLTESVDGMPVGTILYRTQYLDMTYYSPVAPPYLQDTEQEGEINKRYRLWGPWEMPKNQTAYVDSTVSVSPAHYFTNSYMYKNVSIIASAPIDVLKPDGKVLNNWGTFTKNVRVNVKAVSRNYGQATYIYFSLDGLENSISTTSTVVPEGNIGRVILGNTFNRTEKIQVWREATEGNSEYQSIYDNFTHCGNYTLTSVSHEFIEEGRWVNSEGAAKYGLDGKNGEWFYIGYNANGDPLENPYFPSSSLHFRGCMNSADYDWRDTPWSGTDSSYFPELTIYDTEPRFADRRELIIKKFLEEGALKGNPNSSEDVEKYLNKLSFRNHPEHELAILIGQRIGSIATRSISYINELSDLYLAAIKVYDGSKLIASYEYDINTKEVERTEGKDIKPGKEYTVEVYLGNTKNKKIIAAKNQTHMGYKANHKAYSSLPTTLLDEVWMKEQVNTIGSKKGSLSNAFSYTITAPTDVDFFDIYAYVGELHWGTDNLDPENDIGRVRMTMAKDVDDENIQRGEADLAAKKIELLNTKNEVVYSFTRGDKAPSIKKAIIPGESYYIKYTVVNEGEDAKYRIKTPGYWEGEDWIPASWSEWKYDEYEVPINYNYLRIISAQTGSSTDIVPPLEQSSYSGTSRTQFNNSTLFTIKAGQEMVFKTETPIVMENPYLEVGFTIKCDQAINKDNTNDSLNVVIGGKHDVVIGDVRVFPKYEFTGNGEKVVSYTVSYDATLDVESYVPKDDAYSLVETSINIGNKTVIVTDLLKGGENNNITHTVDNITVSPSDNLVATVILNYHKHTYETNYDNNRGVSDVTTIRAISNPFNGSNTDKAKGQDTSDGSTFTGGGSANNNCLLPRTKNTWSVSHREHIWSASVKTYNSTDGTSRSFKKYSTISDTKLAAKDYSEEFKIVNVMFRSKETIDSKSGVNKDGWVDLSDAKQKDLGVIKAGYGFELKIVTEYSTNVLKTQPKSIVNANRTNGTDYSDIVGENSINYSKELFVELPGSDSKRKILSTTGYGNTIKGLNVKEEDISTSEKTIKRFTYTIKPTNTNNVSDSDKIFIPENIINGDYKISVYTAPISGVSSTGKKRYTALCDRKDVSIKVKGSYIDDLNSNIIQ